MIGLALLRGTPLLAVGAAIVVADFITLGGVLIAATGVIVAAIVAYFTIRNLQRSYWRNLVDERDAEIIEMKRLEDEKLQERAAFAEEQRELRHRLKNELAELKKRLELEHAKSDLSTVFSRIDALEAQLKARDPFYEEIVGGIHKQADVLSQILAELRNQT